MMCAFPGCEKGTSVARQFDMDGLYRIYLCKKHLILTWDIRAREIMKQELEKAWKEYADKELKEGCGG